MSFSCDHQTRISFACHLDVRIGGIIHELDIVFRSVFLDQIDFQNKCFFFRSRHDEIKIFNILNKFCCLEVMYTGKVGIDTIMQILCLTDIDDLPTGILHLITAWGMWQILQFCLDVFSVHLLHHHNRCPGSAFLRHAKTILFDISIGCKPVMDSLTQSACAISMDDAECLKTM